MMDELWLVFGICPPMLAAKCMLVEFRSWKGRFLTYLNLSYMTAALEREKNLLHYLDTSLEIGMQGNPVSVRRNHTFLTNKGKASTRWYEFLCDVTLLACKESCIVEKIIMSVNDEKLLEHLLHKDTMPTLKNVRRRHCSFCCCKRWKVYWVWSVIRPAIKGQEWCKTGLWVKGILIWNWKFLVTTL